MTVFTRRGVLAAVGTAPLAGCFTLSLGVEYDLSIRCHDYRSADGRQRNDCSVYLKVSDLGRAELLELRVFDRITGETDLYTVDYDDPLGVAHTGRLGDGELRMRDVVSLAAVYEDGRRDVLEHSVLGSEEGHLV